MRSSYLFPAQFPWLHLPTKGHSFGQVFLSTHLPTPDSWPHPSAFSLLDWERYFTIPCWIPNLCLQLGRERERKGEREESLFIKLYPITQFESSLFRARLTTSVTLLAVKGSICTSVH